MSTTDTDVREEAHVWRARREDGVTADEETQFQEWYRASGRNAEAYAEAELFWLASSKTEFQDAVTNELFHLEEDASSRPSTENEVSSYEASAVAKITVGSVITVAFATLCLFLTGPAVLFGGPELVFERFASDRGQTRVITLSDNTKITLSAASEIEVSVTDDTRLARLHRGAAYFEVTSDPSRPFIVDTTLADVRVTGTAFDVRLRNSSLDVAVGEGAVVVSEDEGNRAQMQTVSLGAGQAVQYRRDTGFSAKTKVYPTELAAWRGGRLIYVEARLDDVIAELNRHSSKSISVGIEAGSLKVSGVYDAQDIQGTLSALEGSLPVSIKRSDNQILIMTE